MKIGPIESDVPVPEIIRNNKYHFERLEVGQSLKFEGGPSESFKRAAYTFAARRGWRFTVRKEGNGFRCWRIA